MSQDIPANLLPEGAPTTPPWPDVDRGPLLLKTTWALLSISTIVVGARFWTKVRKAQRLYADDMFMLSALVFGLVHTALLTKSISYGLGRHMLYLDQYERENTLEYGTIGLGWGFLSPMSGRVAFCITMLYVAGTDRKVHRWAKFTTWIFIVLQIVVNMLAFIVFYAQCGTQLNIFWTTSNAALVETQCMPAYIQTDLGYFQGAFNCLTDAYLTALPGILIEHARLSLKRKIGLACLLCLSIVALTAAIVKTYEAKALSEVADYTYDLCEYVIWISVELNVVIIASSVPLLRPLFLRRRQRLPDENSPGWDTITLNSSRFRERVAAMSSSSQENIVPTNSQAFHMADAQPGGITVTKEVQVTVESTEVQFIHAALVGLVQGEMANSKIMNRERRNRR